MNNRTKRVVIYTKDVRNITGRRDRAARELLRMIRKKNKKERGNFITVDEFCDYTGIKEEMVRSFLQ